MKPDEFRDMQILHEVQQNPSITQRDLGKKIGLALGLTNLRLHRLCTEGCINIVEASKNRISYVVTPKGGQEKERLIAEYFDASMGYYRDVRQFLKQRLLVLAEQQVRRILLYGTGEIAEAAYLTIQEVGLDLVAVVGEASQRQSFFNLPIRDISDLETLEFDRVIIAAFESGAPNGHQGLSRIPKEKVIRLPENPTSLPRPSLRGWFSSASAVSWEARPSATDVVILCGGRGTRLKSLTAATPKPLLPVGDQPFLLKLLLRLKQEGFQRILLAAHYLPNQFELFLEKYRSQLPEVRLIVEGSPLGTGGALRHAIDSVITSQFVVLNGDTWVQQPLQPVLSEHQQSDRDFTVIAVQAGSVEGEALKKGVWRIGSGGQVLGFDTQEMVSEGWVNAGCYVLSRSMVGSWPVGSYSLETNLPVLLNGRKSGVFCSEGRLLDIGTPQTYERAGRVLCSYEGALS